MPRDLPPVSIPIQALHNLPLQLTSFVGREREIVEVSRLLATNRLLTLTGSGGCGKTRLAFQVAADALADYPQGVWVVELAAIEDRSLVAEAVASAVGMRLTSGVPLTDRLVSYLHSRTLLLVLDNCEHVVDAVAHLADALLRSCAGLRILATSREALSNLGETTWRVPSLSLPPRVPAGDLPLEGLTRYEAVRLFLDRARASSPDFALTDRNVPAAIEICRRLDGIPLAIELAAARTRVFTVEQIATRLDDRFQLLTGGPRTATPRQQTLLAMVDWSYALLSEPERMLLRRLSVFSSDWSFEAAEAVGAGDGIHSYAVLDLLAQLVDKSLVIAEEQRGAVRYRLLDTIRQYGRDRLLEAGETERARELHLAYFLALAEQCEPRLRGGEDRVVVDRLEQEHDNLRVALDWALTRERDGEAALRLSGALTWFWWVRSNHDEGWRWLTRALERSPNRSAARMKALHGAGWLAHHRRDSALARALLDESLSIARDLDDRWTQAWVLHHLGRVAYFDDDSATARAFGEQSLEAAEAVGDDWLTAWALHLLGLAAHIAADFPTARAHYERSLAMRRRLEYREGLGILLVLLGLVALREGDLPRAHALNREALPNIQAVHGPWGFCMPLGSFARLAAMQGQPRRAVRLGSAAVALSETYHTPLIPMMETALSEGLDIARQTLSAADFQESGREGRAMTLEESLADALAIEGAPRESSSERPQQRRAAGAAGALSATEHQILRLLADGRTTSEIAAEMVVAVSTVDRHITHIYTKLGVRNRAAATAMALKQGLV